MDKELFELCKEVYEKTGWEPIKELQGEKNINGRTPLYTSDYLLEKLQQSATDYNVQVYYSVTQKYWKALLVHYGSPIIGDTPLKALLKLSIALHEAGKL